MTVNSLVLASAGGSVVVPLGLLLVGVLLIGVGLWGIRRTVDNVRHARRLRKTETSDISMIRPDSGFVEIEGTARAGDDSTLAAPVGETDAVVRFEEAEKRLGSGGDQSKEWSTVGRHFETVPFHVEDGTGRARVDVPPVNLDALPDAQRRPHLTDPQPSPLLDRTAERRFVPGESHDEEVESHPIPEKLTALFDADFDDEETYRFREQSVQPGETVYVAGYPERAPPENDVDVVISGDDSPGHVVVGNKSEEDIESGMYLKLLGLLAVAGLLFVAGVGVLGLAASLAGLV